MWNEQVSHSYEERNGTKCLLNVLPPIKTFVLSDQTKWSHI